MQFTQSVFCSFFLWLRCKKPFLIPALNSESTHSPIIYLLFAVNFFPCCLFAVSKYKQILGNPKTRNVLPDSCSSPFHHLFLGAGYQARDHERASRLPTNIIYLFSFDCSESRSLCLLPFGTRKIADDQNCQSMMSKNIPTLSFSTSSLNPT